MIVTLQDGDTVNITVDFSKEPGSVDKNGHTIFTNEEQIDAFIEAGIGYEPLPDELDVEANDLLMNNLKKDETFENIKSLII